MVCGWHPDCSSLGGCEVVPPADDASSAVKNAAGGLRQLASAGEETHAEVDADLKADLDEAREIFVAYYSRESRFGQLQELWRQLQSATTDEARAEAVTGIWLPELRLTDSEILARWQLADVRPNPSPIQAHEVVIQLNALYTLAESVPEDLPENLEAEWKSVRENPGEKVADYDHPVALFESGAAHELVNCLDELNADIDFEKQQGVLASEYRFPVLISVSVTHRNLDALCGEWVEHVLRNRRLSHLSCLVLTEKKIRRITDEFLGDEFPIFSVLGKYGVHFNALKYMQLFYEKAFGIRAGFKLDTDEGIRSKDHWEATGQTWLQTMCHNLWGGTALDHRGKQVSLGVNEGEYMNWSDISSLGYKAAMREPDVRPPASYLGGDIFFNKGFAHGRATGLYNQCERLDDHVSHPVVKGGGYGITNEGLRQAVPFTYSEVGRAEDQQFYFSSLARGCRGIFHPDLRIAHYKSAGGAVAKAEEKTQTSRFIGDLFRLVIFGEIASRLDVKDDIDPMPGVFASELARAQALLSLLYKAYRLATQGNTDACEELMTSGLAELRGLRKRIDDGAVREGMQTEHAVWRQFISAVDSLSEEGVRNELTEMTLRQG